MKEEQFVKILKLLGTAYNKEFDKEQTEVWYSFLKKYQYEVLLDAIKNIISKNKYMPSISEVEEECKKQKENIRHEIVEFMNKQGYFKSIEEYDKANKWLNEDVIPHWFLEDMKNYYSKFIEYKNQKLLGD